MARITASARIMEVHIEYMRTNFNEPSVSTSAPIPKTNMGIEQTAAIPFADLSMTVQYPMPSAYLWCTLCKGLPVYFIQMQQSFMNFIFYNTIVSGLYSFPITAHRLRLKSIVSSALNEVNAEFINLKLKANSNLPLNATKMLRR